MSFGTVFKYLKTVKDMTITAEWLTPTLVVLLYIHEGNYLSFRADDGDTCVHAVVRYAVITGMQDGGGEITYLLTDKFGWYKRH